MASIQHPLESRFIAVISEGRHLTLEVVGGIEQVREHVHILGASPLMPDILEMLLAVRYKALDNTAESVDEVIIQLLEYAATDFVLCDAIDALDAARPLDRRIEDRCFEILLQKAERTSLRLTGLARRFALEGAFRFAVGSRRRELRILAHLLGVERDDDAYYLAGAAKIAGVAYSHWRESDLITLLEQLTAVDEAHATAHFELGMAKLSQAFQNQGGADDDSYYSAAQTEFQLAAQTSALEAEAQLYANCLALIRAFHNGADSRTLAPMYEAVRDSAFQMTATQDKSCTPSWLGARYAEATCWHVLMTRLTEVVEQLNQPSWWNPQYIIEQHLMTAYCATRSILSCRENRGLEGLIRPRIERDMAARDGLVHQLKIWIEQNTSHDLRSEADTLVSQIEAFATEVGSPPRPSEAAPDWSSIAAFIEQTAAPDHVKQVFLTVLASAITLNMENMSAAVLGVLERCHSAIACHPDYARNPNGTRLFDTALYWTLQFVQNRLELTQKDDSSLSYLFEREDGALPTEDALQDDYYRFLSAYAAGTDLEPMNVGSGRADIRMRSSGERLVIEIKREASDCSFAALSSAYAAQTTDYQNVSIRLGFLLVLDQCVPNLEGTPHISSLFEPKFVQRTGEALPRAIIIVRVPGRRKRPSDLSRSPKRSRSGRTGGSKKKT